MSRPAAATVTAGPSAPTPPSDDFSLVLGGPLYQLYMRGRLLRPPAALLERRIVAFVVLTWLPLLVLTLASGTAVTGVKVPFLFDIDVHIRFLLCLPLMIAAELLVHQRLRLVVGQFFDRDIIVPEQRARFDEIVASTRRLRNSVAVEVALLVAAATVGHWIWRNAMSLHVDTWYVTLGPGGEERLTLAGWWYAFVSLSVFRFVLGRWYFRIVVWYVFMWRVARLPLRLNPLHPDRAGGLGFLGNSVFAFLPLLLAHTAGIAGVIASRIWHEGMQLPAFQLEIVGSVAMLMVMVLLPLTFFTFRLAQAKREGIRQYGLLGMQYVDEFRDKWLRERRPTGEPLVGTADVQSLADLAGAYDVVREMRALPFGKQTFISLAIVTAAPYLPLALTMVPFKELVTRVITKLL